MNARSFLPDADRAGVLTSTVLLSLALNHLIRSPDFNLELQLPGFFLSVPLNLSTAMSLLTAGLTATGMDWLLRGHPSLQGRGTFQWWILPTLSTFVISVLLNILPPGRAWWIGFGVSGAFLFFVFLAEYIVVDPGAPRYGTAMAGLTAISYTLFFILTIALRLSDARLFLMLPALFLSSALAGLRILHLRLSGHWDYPWAIGTGFICTQVAAALNYWPLSPIQFGLMLVGPLYGLVTLAANLSEDLSPRRAALEPAVAAALCWGLALVIR